MRKLVTAFAIAVTVPLAVSPLAAGQIQQLKDLGKQAKAEVTKGIILTEEEERQLGADISAQLRQRFGVVQDAAVHKYVTMVGTLLAQQSSRPGLKWTFIVLDTDGVNAFSAPGGFVHITKGALALIQDEAELACVLGHEVAHITEKHTLNAILKSKLVSAGVSTLTRDNLLQELGKLGYQKSFENTFDQGEEKGSDRIAIALANGAGYAPTGLSGFLTRLAERNKGLKERSGVFASYPDTQARLDEIAKTIKSKKLTAAALVQPRYKSTVKFTLVPMAQLAQAAPAPAGTEKPAATPTPSPSGKFGLSDITKAVGLEKSNSSAVASTGSRGVNRDRDATGGPNKTLVVVTVTAAELEAFKKGIS